MEGVRGTISYRGAFLEWGCVCVEAMLDLPLHMCIEEDISLGLLTVKPLSPLKWILGHRYDIALKSTFLDSEVKNPIHVL